MSPTHRRSPRIDLPCAGPTTISACEGTKVEFAACYAYSPHGRGAVARGSRALRARLKNADPAWLARYANRVRALASESGRFAGFFGPDVLLVPVPGSRPGGRGRIWVAERLARELVRTGLAGGIWPALKRVAPVRKSATAVAGARPTVSEQRASLAVVRRDPGVRHGEDLRSRSRLLLVDDIVTKGRTLLSAATTLRDAFPAAEVRAFALARTMGLVAGLEHLVAPCEGEIRFEAGDARREP